jgi:hypothetical protein
MANPVVGALDRRPSYKALCILYHYIGFFGIRPVVYSLNQSLFVTRLR